ncbi:GMC family oxidoreductase [Microbacterium sp. NPDC090281]|uniref:GMC family oxidoreductase n=1 Tax=Microbacterium sp. NPDC090281 TaxID=3364208 RepID=UPI00381C9DC0
MTRLNRRQFLGGGLVALGAGALAAATSIRNSPATPDTAGPRRDVTPTDALETERDYDYIVVGAGAGGGPLAVRLAEAGYTVLVIEAGPATTTADVYEVPAFHLFASSDPEMSWDYYVSHYTDPAAHGSAFIRERGGVLYPRASTLGGCTAHHALLMLAPEDEDWNRIGRITGDPSWNAGFMARYQDRVREWLPIETSPASILSQDQTLARLVTAAVADTADQALPPTDVDLNRGEIGGTLLDPNNPASVQAYREGAALIPQSSRDGKRYGVRERLLEAAPKLKDRLFFQTDALVERVLFEPGADAPRAIGVELLLAPYAYAASPRQVVLTSAERDSARRRVTARREVILAAGAYNTPQLLMLSGVGDTEQLAEQNIPVVVDLPAVGSNLQDRYEMTVVTEFDRRFAVLKDATYGRAGDPELSKWRAGDPNALYRSNGLLIGLKERYSQGSEHPELFLFGAPSQFTGYRPGFAEDGVASKRHFNWAVVRGFQESMTGRVRLRSADPTDVPDINFAYFADGRDTESTSRDLEALREGIAKAREINERARSLRFADTATDREVYPGEGVEGSELDGLIRRDAWGHHASCTVPMGKVGDPAAALDSHFRVQGTEALRVVDASVFPKIPGLFPLMALFALSERAADLILEDASTAGASAGADTTESAA